MARKSFVIDLIRLSRSPAMQKTLFALVLFCSMNSMLAFGWQFSRIDWTEALPRNSHEALSALLADGAQIEFDASGNVVAINLLGTESSCRLGQFAQFPQLESLHIRNCGLLYDENFTGIGRLTNLRELKLEFADEVTQLALETLMHLENLEALTISRCEQVKDFSPLGRCKHLKRLRLNAEEINQSVSFLGDIQTIEELTLSGNQAVECDFSWLERLPELKRLELSFDTGLSDTDLFALAELNSLQELRVRCNDVTGEFLGRLALPSLSVLEVEGEAFEFSKLEQLQNKEHLQRLVVKSTKPAKTNVSLARYPWLSEFVALQDLRLSAYAVDPVDLLNLPDNAVIRVLSIKGRYENEDNSVVRTINRLPKLEALALIRFRSVDSDVLEAIASLPALIELILDDSRIRTDDLDALAKSESLTRLSLSNSSIITDDHIVSLGTLETLEALDVSRQTRISDRAIAALSACPNLKHIVMSQCRKMTLTAFENFSKSHPLETVCMTGVKGISFDGFRILIHLPNLRNLQLLSEDLSYPEFLDEAAKAKQLVISRVGASEVEEASGNFVMERYLARKKRSGFNEDEVFDIRFEISTKVE
ncbi:MAG: hypothetical protein R3C03_15965 [Pirellulaceae bacterium]